MSDKDKIMKAWAKMHLLSGIVDPSAKEEWFPKGRLETAHKISIDVFGLLDDIVRHDKGKSSPN